MELYIFDTKSLGEYAPDALYPVDALLWELA
jgi:hypothetical protein